MKKILFFTIITFLLGGCVKNEPAPVWLEIDKWSLEDNPLVDPGHLSHNFTDVWVYVDNKLLGVFELPCKVPVMMEGTNKSIRLYPTIRNNGISATKKIYPFVEPFEVYQDFVPGSTITLSPTTRYYSNCEFWLEDFESSSSKFNDDTESTAQMTIENNSSIAISGKYGQIMLNGSNDSLWLGIGSEIVQLPKGGEQVYLEIDYRNTINIEQGLTAVFSDGSISENPYGQMNKQDSGSLKWKKIYFDLKEIVSYYTASIGYKPTLKAFVSESTGSGEIQIDNIRLVYF